MKILFDQWTPDRPGVASNLSEAKNIIPTNVGYLPLEEAEDISAAASQNLYVSIPIKFAGTQYLFAAGESKIFKFNPTNIALDDVSRVTAYTVTDFWDHAQFGGVSLCPMGKTSYRVIR